MTTTYWHSVSNSDETTYSNYRKPTSNSSFGSKITSNNIEDGGYPIVDAFQVAGHHVVGTESQLYCIPLSILSPNYANSIGIDEGETTSDLSGQDALGQIWYVNRSKKYYRLDKFPTHVADFSKNTDLTYNSTYAGSKWTEVTIIPASEYSTFLKKSPLPGNEIEYIWAGTQANYKALGDVSKYLTTLFIIKE